MLPNHEYSIGAHVRLLPDAYIRLQMPRSNWTGTIEAVRQSEMGNRTAYLFHVDELFDADEDDFYVFEEEIEKCRSASGQSSNF